jgi:hypothetical protein
MEQLLQAIKRDLDDLAAKLAEQERKKLRMLAALGRLPLAEKPADKWLA